MPDVMEKTPQTVRSLRATAGLPLLPRRVPIRQLEIHRYSWKKKNTMKVEKSEAAL